MKLQELRNDEMKNINGGGLFGDDNSSLTGVLQGSLGVTNTDDDGDTESTMIDFGLGSIFNSMND